MDNGALFNGIAWLSVLWLVAGIGLLVYWMVIAWRAMKALEKMARNSDEAIHALRAWWKMQRDEES